jgi:flavin reductase (DIM6/NTAB) family NADH-FMN oxidoreductase RutF
MIKHVPDEVRNTIGKALGRIPSGLFILTARHENRSSAMLASWVQQCAFAPPAISVAVAKDRPVYELIQKSRTFALSIVPEGDSTLMKKYARGIPEGVDPFDGVRTQSAPSGSPVLSDALAWLDCRVIQTFAFNADHDLLVGQVTAGELLKEGQAFAHQRGNGFHY